MGSMEAAVGWNQAARAVTAISAAAATASSPAPRPLLPYSNARITPTPTAAHALPMAMPRRVDSFRRARQGRLPPFL